MLKNKKKAEIRQTSNLLNIQKRKIGEQFLKCTLNKASEAGYKIALKLVWQNANL